MLGVGTRTPNDLVNSEFRGLPIYINAQIRCVHHCLKLTRTTERRTFYSIQNLV